MTIDIFSHNARAWDGAAERREIWSTPVTDDDIEAARGGEFSVLLTPERPVPTDWLPPMSGLSLLGLASGGGQQGPLFAAAGAHVTVVDASEGQLALDRQVAERHDLPIDLVRADVADLTMFDDQSFDLVFHPSSNSYIADIQPVWNEAYRVLRPGGHLLAGFDNPVNFVFDPDDLDNDIFTVRYSLPHNDVTALPDDQLRKRITAGEPLEHSHTLEEQIGGQLLAGFEIIGLYEDHWDDHPLSRYMPTSVATRARKPFAPPAD